jgi:hypothetical protein
MDRWRRRIGASVIAWLASCVGAPHPVQSVASGSEMQWERGNELTGSVESAAENGVVLVWGSVEGEHLRRGQVIGHAEITIVDASGNVWCTRRAAYREPVASDAASAAAVFCTRVEGEPPPGWRVRVTHHPRVLVSS